MKDYRKLCIELFGTDDETELRKIAGRLRGGRKKALSEKDIAFALELQTKGVGTKEIAEHFGVSRQTISKYLNKPLTGSYVMRLDFMFRHTNDIMKRAFGVNENPTWEDFESFLEERCFPNSRALKKIILQRIGVESYDPLQILELNKGRTAEDNQYINFTRKRRMAF